MWVQCKPCGFKWIGLYTPMPVADVALVMLSLCCPVCATTSKQIYKCEAPR